MKALTLWQPWASLMALGHKKVETRCWATRYRGPVVIHSALRKPEFLGQSAATNEFLAAMKNLKIDSRTLPFGCALAVGNLVAVSETGPVYDDLSFQEQVFGNYEEGRYAWFFENIKPFPVPVPVKGNRLLWNCNDAEVLKWAKHCIDV